LEWFGIMRHNQAEKTSSERIARVIFEHASKIGQQQSVADLVPLNADLARDLTGAERCSLWLVDAGTGELWTRVAQGTDHIRIPSGEGLVGKCADEGKTILVNDTSSDSRFLAGIDQNTGYRTRSVLCVPLHTDAGVIGVLQVMNKAEGFDEGDAELLRLMALYAISSIEAERAREAAQAARILQHELDLAGDVQRRLFPANGRSEALEYVGLCRQARTVGGDYFDFLNLTSGALAVTLGDVSGKGFAASLLMAGIHTLARSLLLRNGMELSGIMFEINEAINRNSSGERYSTLFCGVIDSERGQLRYANAGHLPPMIIRHVDGSFFRPREGNMPLGLMTGTSYQEHLADLYPGDVLVCVSDGIVEAQDVDGNFWDEALLESILYENRNGTAAEIAQSVVSAVDRFADHAEQSDDMTVIVVRLMAAS